MPSTNIVFSPDIDERQLDRETEQVNDQLQQVGQDVPVNFDAEEMDGLAPAGGGGIGGGRDDGLGAGGAGAVAGLASRIPKPIAGVTAGAALPVALAGGVGVGMLSAMQSASARLQTDTKLLGVAVDNFFREPGNVLSENVTRPLADGLADISLQFDETSREEGVGFAIGEASAEIGAAVGGAVTNAFQTEVRGIFEGGASGFFNRLAGRQDRSLGQNIIRGIQDELGVETPIFDVPKATQNLVNDIQNFEWPDFPNLPRSIRNFTWPSLPSLPRSVRDFRWPNFPNLPDVPDTFWPDLPSLPTVPDTFWPDLPGLPRAIQNFEWPSLPSLPRPLQRFTWPSLPSLPRSLRAFQWPSLPSLPRSIRNFDWPNLPSLPSVPDSFWPDYPSLPSPGPDFWPDPPDIDIRGRIDGSAGGRFDFDLDPTTPGNQNLTDLFGVESGQAGGRVRQSGLAEIHKGELIADPDRLVRDLANAVDTATGGGGGTVDMSSVERKLDTLHRDLQRLASAMNNMTIETDRETIGRVAREGLRDGNNDTDPLAD